MNRVIALSIVVAAGCAADPTSSAVVDLPGARNEALKTAAHDHKIGVDWLAAIAYQQGRFEVAGSETTAAPDAEDPAETLAEDTPLDDTGDPTPADDGAAMGDDATLPTSWGLMYLTGDQITEAAALTGRDPEVIKIDIAANIDAAAALIEAHRVGPTDQALRTATAEFPGLADDADSADLALADIDSTLGEGFDLTTDDGERIELIGTAPPDETAERLAPGAMPSYQWIPSPNFSTRQGLAIKYVVIHDMEGTQAGAISVFKNKANQTSAHYLMRARDGHIVKMVLEKNNAWHAGHGWFNRHSIGIEHEGFAHRKNGGGYYTDKAYARSAQLVCSIAHRYHIPVDRKHIFGHMNVPSNLNSHTLCSDARGIAGACGGVSHHSDPGKYWNWTKYMKLVRTCVTAAG